MSKYITIRYKDGYETENGIEYIPKHVSIALHEKDGYFSIKVLEETMTDLVTIGLNHGLDISIEEK